MEESKQNCHHHFKLRKICQSLQKKDSSSNVISLSPDRPVTIGRVIMDGVNTKLLSKTTPLMISRRHATLSVENGRIFVVDHEVYLHPFIDLFPYSHFLACTCACMKIGSFFGGK